MTSLLNIFCVLQHCEYGSVSEKRAKIFNFYRNLFRKVGVTFNYHPVYLLPTITTHFPFFRNRPAILYRTLLMPRLTETKTKRRAFPLKDSQRFVRRKVYCYNRSRLTISNLAMLSVATPKRTRQSAIESCRCNRCLQRYTVSNAERLYF